MKKNIHLPLYKINFHCLSCNWEYQTSSPYSHSSNIKVNGCGNCVHPSLSPSKFKGGEVEKFHQRKEKSRLKKS